MSESNTFISLTVFEDGVWAEKLINPNYIVKYTSIKATNGANSQLKIISSLEPYICKETVLEIARQLNNVVE